MSKTKNEAAVVEPKEQNPEERYRADVLIAAHAGYPNVSAEILEATGRFEGDGPE